MGGEEEEGKVVGGRGEEDWKGDREDEIRREEDKEEEIGTEEDEDVDDESVTEGEATRIDVMTTPADVCIASWNRIGSLLVLSLLASILSLSL